jgi:hypothetical protein
MVKVQNGWQGHTLDEVESLASQSPGSTLSGLNRSDRSMLLSPRIALAATMCQDREFTNVFTNNGPTDSGLDIDDDSPIRVQSLSTGKRLEPSATIVPGSRRKPLARGNLQIKTMKPPQLCRPQVQQRMPSQNAAMEADAVETLLFMSGSPNNSGHFPSTYSPMSQTFSTQTSPLKSQFSPGFKQPQRPYEDKSVLIDRLLHDLDDETNEDLDEALRILEQHRATKVAT